MGEGPAGRGLWKGVRDCTETSRNSASARGHGHAGSVCRACPRSGVEMALSTEALCACVCQEQL